jgi:hypothetical protein
MAASKLTALLASLSLAAAPAAAAPSPEPLEPAPETAKGSELRGRTAYYILPVLVVIALLIAILAGEDEGPESP